MSVYPSTTTGTPTHRAVSYWQPGGGYIVIETRDGQTVDTIGMDPYDIPDGDLFRAGWQRVGSWEGSTPERLTADIRRMPDEIQAVTAARLRLLLSGDGEARERLRDATRALIDSGMSEYEAAATAGVSRMTIRKWLGKDRA
ncbi:MAG: hypothetical protein ACOC9R_02290 [bacterium]